VFGGVDDVGEQDRGDDYVALQRLVRAGEELLDLIDKSVAIAHKEEVIVTGKHDKFGTRDVLGEIAASTNPDVAVPLPVQDQGGNPKQAQQRANVAFETFPHRPRELSRAACEALASGPPLAESLVAESTRGERLHIRSRAPSF
jgi:hypothetical protein